MEQPWSAHDRVKRDRLRFLMNDDGAPTARTDGESFDGSNARSYVVMYKCCTMYSCESHNKVTPTVQRFMENWK